MQPPNKALQLKWFYMAFHSEDHAKYVKSGQCLCNKTLESVAEYFENIFNSQVARGSLAKKGKRQIEHCMKCKMHQALRRQFDENVRHIMEQCHGSDGCHSRQSKTYYCHNYKWKDRDHSDCHHNYNKSEKKQEDKTCSDCSYKAFKPSPMHRPKNNHTFKGCYKNPKNPDKHQAHGKNVNMRCITMMRVTQVTTMSRALV